MGHRARRAAPAGAQLLRPGGGVPGARRPVDWPSSTPSGPSRCSATTPSPETRIDHLARLADCLGLSGDVAARDRYDHVLRLAEELGDVDRQLLVLNNRAYCETVVGAFEEALVWTTKLQDLAGRHGIPMDVGRLDTIGQMVRARAISSATAISASAFGEPPTASRIYIRGTHNYRQSRPALCYAHTPSLTHCQHTKD